MKIAWIGLLIEILIFALLKSFITDFEVAAIIFVGVHSIFVAFSLGKYTGKYALIFFSAYLIRLLTMGWEIYARHIYILPNSASDGDGFFSSAVMISYDLSLLSENIYGGIYSKLLGILFYITSPETIIGQYINVLLGITTLYIIYNTFKLLRIRGRIIKKAIIIISFFPQAIILTAILLRENIISMLIASSFYFFVKWYIRKRNINILYSVSCILVASMFHSGIVFTIIGYMFIFMFYKHKTKTLTFSKKTILIFIIFSVSATIISTTYGDVFVRRFNNLESIENVYDQANIRMGSSTYLNSVNIDSTRKLVLFSPVRMFYFLTSPLPMNWRGLTDIFSFLTDSVLYLYVILLTFKNYKKVKSSEPIVAGIIISILIVTFIFATGVSNAGTAMRHRHKILPIFMSLYAIINEFKLKSIEVKYTDNKLDKINHRV